MSLLSILFLFTLNVFSDSSSVLFTKEGKKAEYNDLVKKCAQADVVLFGELHNNDACHSIEKTLSKALFKIKGKDLLLGAEMFESDDQLALNEYLSGLIELRHFKYEAKCWPNFDSDYLPLVDFAKQNKLSFIATNAPKRYASAVAYKGLNVLDLSSQAKLLLPPLPIDTNFSLPAYHEMKDMGQHSGMHYLAEAQALKDATMAYFINKNYSKNKTFLHFNGSYHSNNYEGIVWYLKRLNPKLKIVTIATVEQEDASVLGKESEGLADFILVVKPEKKEEEKK